MSEFERRRLIDKADKLEDARMMFDNSRIAEEISRNFYQLIGYHTGIEVKVPNLKIARDSYRRVIARGRRVVYMPQELAAPDKIPILCQTFGFRLPDDFDPNLFENEADQWGWYHVEGSAATPNFPSNQKDIDVMYEKLGVEGQTLNTYLLASAHNWIANRRHFDQAIKTRAILTGSIYKGYPIGVYSEKGGAMQIIPEKNLYERILYRGVRSAGLIERV